MVAKIIQTSDKGRLNYIKGPKKIPPFSTLFRFLSLIITTIVNQPIYNHVTLITVLSALQMSTWFFIRMYIVM